MNDLALNSLYVQTGGERSQLSGRDMLRLLRDHIFEVLGVALCVTALALAYVFLATPIYEADVLVRVDPPEPNALGISAQGPQYAPPAPSPSTEMAVMQSRSVLEPIINRFRRQALHAYLLQIEHPRTGEVMRFESDLPDDLMELIDALRI